MSQPLSQHSSTTAAAPPSASPIHDANALERAAAHARTRRSEACREVRLGVNALPSLAGVTRVFACGLLAGLLVGVLAVSDARADEPAASPVEPTAPAADAGSEGPAVSVQLNFDLTNAYFYRGIRQQDKGLIVQPAARLTAELVETDEIKLEGFLGMWNSIGSNPGTRTGGITRDWYESDVYAGLTLTHGKLTVTGSYTFLTSPSGAFQSVQELGVTVGLDDSEWLKAWALKPYAAFAIETGSNGSDSPDLDTGAYIEFGISPGFSLGRDVAPVTLSFPVSVGFSLSEYYQDASGSDDTFGFAQAGLKASVPLGAKTRFGAWTLSAGVSVLMLGDHTQALNRGDATEIVGTVGLQWNF